VRLRNWDVRLFAWADGVAGRAFAWGKTDCGYLIRDAHKAMYGKDVLRWPTYASKRGAISAQKKVGGIPNALAKACTEVGRRFARSGDVVVITHKGQYGMGVVVGMNVVGTYPGERVHLVPLGIVPDDATFWRMA
jgi:hypothetical protein